MIDVGSVWKGAVGLAGVGVRSFQGTLLAVSAAGLLLAGASAYLLREHPVYATIAAGVAIAESITAGVLLGGQRAVVMALVHGLRSLRLGRAAVDLVFERLLGVSTAQEFGTLARAAERLPLAQAERRLTAVVNQLVGDPAAGGWFRRRLHARLLSAVGKYTLVRFRQEGARHGEVDLVGLRAELEAKVDDGLVRKFRRGLTVWAVLVVAGLPATVFAQIFIIIALLNAK